MFLDLINHTYNLPVMLVGLAAILIVYHLVKTLFSPLRNVPGPTLARFTRLWELYQNFRGQFEHVTIALHKRYGIRSIPVLLPAPLTPNRIHSPFGAQSLQHQRS